VGTASRGVASEVLGLPCEDSITLTVQWENIGTDNIAGDLYLLACCLMHLLLHPYILHLSHPKEVLEQARAVPFILRPGLHPRVSQSKPYHESFLYPTYIIHVGDVHSQQRFFYMGQKGEVNIGNFSSYPFLFLFILRCVGLFE
jgi:hypothetical protein